MGRWFRWAAYRQQLQQEKKKAQSSEEMLYCWMIKARGKQIHPHLELISAAGFEHVSIPEAPGHTAVLCTLNITPQPPITAPRTTFQQLHSRCRSRHESRLEWFAQKMRKCFSFGKKSYFSTNVWQHLNHRNATLSLPDKNSAFLCLYLLSLTPNGGRHEQNLISQYE